MKVCLLYERLSFSLLTRWWEQSKCFWEPKLSFSTFNNVWCAAQLFPALAALFSGSFPAAVGAIITLAGFSHVMLCMMQSSFEKRKKKKATDSRWAFATVQDVQTLLFTFKNRNACPQRRPICLVFLFVNLWPEISSSIWTFTVRHKKAGFWGLSEHTPHRGGNWQELKLCCYDEMTGFVGFL